MTTKGAVKPAQATKYAHLEPLPDPPKVIKMEQFKSINLFASVLSARFADRSDVLISGEGYVCRTRSDLNPLFVPDCIFVDGLADPDGVIATNGYVIDEVGKPPDLVFGAASKSTGRRDITVKREGYALFGVPEYWRFDPSGGEYHGVALAGDKLVDGKYEPIEIHGEPCNLFWGYSAVLDLQVCSDDKRLRFRDPATMEFLLDNVEAQAEAARLREQLRRLKQG